MSIYGSWPCGRTTQPFLFTQQCFVRQIHVVRTVSTMEIKTMNHLSNKFDVLPVFVIWKQNGFHWRSWPVRSDLFDGGTVPVFFFLCWSFHSMKNRFVEKTTPDLHRVRWFDQGREREGGRGRLYTYRYTVTTRMTSALRWAAMRAILMFRNCEGQSHKTVHRPQLLKRKESRSGFEPRSLCLPA